MEFWKFVLTSTLVSTFIGGIILLITNKVSQRNSYRDDYFKLIITKRLAAYEYVSQLIANLKLSSIDADNKPYHLLIANDNIILSLGQSLTNNLWLSNKMTDILTELNKITFKISSDDENVRIRQAKEHYDEIGKIRIEMENCLKKDLQELHDVKGFLKIRTKNKPITYSK